MIIENSHNHFVNFLDFIEENRKLIHMGNLCVSLLKESVIFHLLWNFAFQQPLLELTVERELSFINFDRL